MYQEEDLDLKQGKVHGHNVCVISNESEFRALLKVLKDNDSRYISIDLAKFKLTIKDLEILNEIIQDNVHIGYIKFSSGIKNNDENIKEGKQEEENNNYLKTQNTNIIAKLKNEIFKKCNENNQLLRCPSDYVHGLISADIYNDLREGEGKDFNGENWQVIKIYHTKDSSYYGALYQNTKTESIVLAHRGTAIELKDLVGKNNDITADLRGVLQSEIVIQQAQAYVATVGAVDKARNDNLHLSVTGHSLGGSYAGLSVFFAFNDLDYHEIKCVNFDSSGSYRLMKKFKTNIHNDQGTYELKNLPIVTYLSTPNIVNTCDKHIGRMYGVYPNFEAILDGRLDTILESTSKTRCLKTISAHSIKIILKEFNKDTGRANDYAEIIDWPVIEYKPWVKPIESAKILKKKTKPLTKSIKDGIIDVAGPVISTITTGGIFAAPIIKAGLKLVAKGADLVLGKSLDAVAGKIIDKATDNAAGDVVDVLLSYFDNKIDNRQFITLVDKHLKVEKNDKYYIEIKTEEDRFKLHFESHYHTKYADKVEREIITKDTRENRLLYSLNKYKERIHKEAKGPSEIHLSNELKDLSAQYDISPSTINNNNKDLLINKSDNRFTLREIKERIYRLHKANPVFREILVNANKPNKHDTIETHFSSITYLADFPVLKDNISKFIGRGEELSFIERTLNSKNNNKCIISGLEGAGKSSLAIKYGSMQQESNILVRWIDAANAETLTQSAIKFATDLHIHTEGKTIDSISREISLCLNNMINADNSKKQTLLILDNLEDYELIEKFLPNLSSNIKLLITARSKTLHIYKDLFEVKLEFFSQSEAKEYIESRLEQYKDQAKELIDIVGTQPNKLSIAVSQIKRSRISIESYIRKGKYKNVIESSFKCLKTLKPEAMQVLAYTAYLYAGSIPFSLLPEEVLNEEIISELEGLSLLTSYDGEQEVLSIHREVQEKLCDLIEKGKIANIKKDLIIKNIINALDEQMPKINDNPNDDWKTAIKLAPHIEYVLNAVKNNKEYSIEESASLTMKLAAYDRHITLNYNKALENCNIVLTIYRTMYKDQPNHPSIASIFNNIGNTYQAQGKYEEALEYYTKALTMYKEVYKDLPNHPDIAFSWSNIGNIQRETGKYDEALENYKKALKIREEIYKDKPEHCDIARSFYDMGNIYYAKKLYKEALTNHNKALEMRKKLPTLTHIAASLNSIGQIYLAQGKYDEALENYEEALKVRKEMYKDQFKHPDIAVSLNNIGNTYQAQGQYKEALNYYLKALEILKEVYKDQSNHSDIADSFSNIGQIYEIQGLYKEALNYHRDALKILKEVYKDSPNNPNIACVFSNIGSVYHEQGQYRESLNYHMNALKIYREVYKDSPNHLNIADSFRDIAQIYQLQGQQEKALSYYLKALEILKEVYKDSSNHPGIAFALNNVGNIYHEQRQYDEALNYYLKALEILKEVYKDQPDHPDIADSLMDIAQIYQVQGQHEESLDYNLKALEILKKVYKDLPNHPDIACSFRNLAQIYLEQKFYKEALKYCKEALEICDQSHYSNISQLIDQIQTIEDEQSRELLSKDQNQSSAVQERLWVEKVAESVNDKKRSPDNAQLKDKNSDLKKQKER